MSNVTPQYIFLRLKNIFDRWIYFRCVNLFEYTILAVQTTVIPVFTQCLCLQLNGKTDTIVTVFYTMLNSLSTVW